MRYVETMQTVKRQDSSYTINDAVGALFSKLDKAIDDMENGRA